MGMGLPIVKKAAKKLNGGINLYSEVSKGTYFHIYLSQYFPENIYPE